MDLAALLLAALVLFTFVVDKVLRRLNHSVSRFPTCRQCRRTMTRVPNKPPFPEEIQKYLDDLVLPEIVVSSYVCPLGHIRAWFVPRFGDREKGLFVAKHM